MIPTKNYNLIGFVKKEISQNWTTIPDGTIITIPEETENIIDFASEVLKTKFPYFMFFLEEIK